MDEPRFTDAAHAAAWRKERIGVLEETLAHERQELADCIRGGQRLAALLAEEEDATDALKAALHALTDEFRDAHSCPYCAPPWWQGRALHALDCPWLTARTLLKGEG